MSFEEKYFNSNSESLENISTNDLLSLLHPKIEKAITLDGVRSKLMDGERLSVKFGADPTGPELHIGHAVPMRVVDIFSRAGHNIDLIFGDFTAKIGDPTGRSDERPQLTDEQISDNMSTFKEQVDSYLDVTRDNVRIHRNSSWLGKMALSSVFQYLQVINLSQAMQRDDFRQRAQKGQSVSLAEVMYGAMMGIDSHQLETDVEIGGIDQLLNFQQTRDIQRHLGQTPEDVVMTPIIEGTGNDGRKMSKSYANYIPISTDADNLFGKIMSIPDSSIISYIKAFAPVRDDELNSIEGATLNDPMEMKKQLATYMVATAKKDRAIGLAAREDFERKFSRKEINVSDAEPLIARSSLIDTLLSSGHFKSRSEVRRLAAQGGVKVDGSKIDEEELGGASLVGSLVSVGKRRIFAIKEARDEP